MDGCETQQKVSISRVACACGERGGKGGPATDHLTCTIDSFFGQISSNVSASIFHEERIADRMPR